MRVEPRGDVGVRFRPAPVVVCVVAGAAVVAAYVLERGNVPYSPILQPADNVVVTVMFSVGLLGTVVLLLHPGHLTGRLMLWSGVWWAVGLLGHAVAVRMLLVWPEPVAAAKAAAWAATFAYAPAFGLLLFVPLTWPAGRVTGRGRRASAACAAVALVLMTVGQAFAPHRLDGVARGEIGNPLGVRAFAAPVAVVTAAAVVVLAAFTVVSLADLVRRAVGARGEQRRQYRPVLLALGVAVLAAVGTLPWRGGWSGLFVGVAVAVAGSSVAIGVAAAAMRRSERVERARALLVAERESERARLRRELHDGVGPLLAALRLEIDGLGGGGLGVELETGRARVLLADAMAEVRRISRDLRPVALDELGLLGALRRQAEVLNGADGPAIQLALPDRIPAALPAAVEVALIRIAGEALTNVVRHASAERCGLRLEVDKVVRLEVRDDGVGVPAHTAYGVGIRSMVERAEELGGRCDIAAAPGGGTLVSARLPWQQ